jgi:hypothetical protein
LYGGAGELALECLLDGLHVGGSGFPQDVHDFEFERSQVVTLFIALRPRHDVS